MSMTARQVQQDSSILLVSVLAPVHAFVAVDEDVAPRNLFALGRMAPISFRFTLPCQPRAGMHLVPVGDLCDLGDSRLVVAIY